MKNHKGVVYICAPFRGASVKEIERNVERAKTIGKILFDVGFIPLVPHINSKALFGLKGDNRKVTRFDNALLSKCDAMILCLINGIKPTKGMLAEIRFCDKRHIPIIRCEVSVT